MKAAWLAILPVLLVSSLAKSAAMAEELRLVPDSSTVKNGSSEEIPTIDIDPVGTLRPAELPEHIKPLESGSPALEPFLGVWRGQWEGTLDTYLTVTEAEGNRVKVFYSWGTNAITREPGKRYVWGVIHSGVMLLPGDGTSISLEPQDDASLFGLFYSPRVHMPSRIVMTREN